MIHKKTDSAEVPPGESARGRVSGTPVKGVGGERYWETLRGFGVFGSLGTRLGSA